MANNSPYLAEGSYILGEKKMDLFEIDLDKGQIKKDLNNFYPENLHDQKLSLEGKVLSQEVFEETDFQIDSDFENAEEEIDSKSFWLVLNKFHIHALNLEIGK